MTLHENTTSKTKPWIVDYTKENVLDGSRQLGRLGPLQPKKVYTPKIMLKSKITVSKDGKTYDAFCEQRYVHNFL